MWKNYIEIIKQNKCNTTQEYCNYFINNFSFLKKINKKEIIKILSTPCDTLFTERYNLENILHQGRLSEIISIFYHYFEIDWNCIVGSDIQLQKQLSLEENYIKIFFDLSKSKFLKNVMFDTEKLLSDDNNTLSYLFLYFLPCTQKNNLIFHEQKKRPLLTCNKITQNHFNMMMFLMKEYEEDEFSLLCQNYNLNHLLIEDFIEESIYLHDFDFNTNWENILPMEKIKILLKENCTFKAFEELRDKKKFFTFPYLPKKLIEIEIIFFHEQLEKLLEFKNSDNKLLKI